MEQVIRTPDGINSNVGIITGYNRFALVESLLQVVTVSGGGVHIEGRGNEARDLTEEVRGRKWLCVWRPKCLKEGDTD